MDVSLLVLVPALNVAEENVFQVGAGRFKSVAGRFQAVNVNQGRRQ